MRLSDNTGGDKDNKENGDEAPFDSEEGVSLFRFHVRNVVRCEEEGDIGRNEDREHAPPFVDPDKGPVGGSREEGLDKREEQCHLYSPDQLAAYAFFTVLREVSLRGVVREHFPGDNTCEREHHRELPAYAYQENEGGGSV